MAKRKKIYPYIFLTGIAACILGSLSISIAAPITTGGIPEPSGGSQVEPVPSKKGVLGPYSGEQAALQANQPIAEPADVTVGTVFEGFNFDDNATENDGFLFIPPDPMGAAGTDRIIAVVNKMIEARDKAGTLLFRDGLRDFFTPLTPSTYPFDPKVIYDHYEDRFVVVALERIHAGSNPDSDNDSRILLAVSTSGMPASATSADWVYHSITSETSFGGLDHWADYPGFELDEEAVYLTANMFEHPGGTGTTFGVRLWIIDKGAGSGGFYDGGPAAVTLHDPYAAAGNAATTMPCQIYGDTGVGPNIGTFLVSYSGLSDGVNEFVQIVRVDNPLTAPTFTQEFVNIGDIENLGAALPDAPQTGTTELVEVNDRRALDCVWRDNTLWLTTTINPNSGTDAGETTAHWFRLDTTAVPSPITLADQGDIGGEDIAPGTFTFFPSVAVNSDGNAKFGFSASAPTIFPGAYVTGREAGDAAGTVQNSETVHAGQDFYIRAFGGSRNRWGDYSGIALDPLNDDLFWVFNEYAAPRGTVIDGEDGRWGTAWANSIFTSSSTAVDIYFLIDTSGSYIDDLPTFKAEAPEIISTLQASFPDTRFGLGTFEDYPISPFGSASSGDMAYRQNVDLTSDSAPLLALIDDDDSNGELETKNGVDWPQSQLTALYQAATGAGQGVSGDADYIESGQQANFRDGAIKLFLLFTDAPYHNPGDPGDIPYPGESFNDTVDAILALDPPQVLSVISDCSDGCPSGTFEDAVADAEDMAVATNSIAPAGGVDCNNDGVIDIPEGDPLVCTTPPASAGIKDVVVKIVRGAIEAVTPVARCKDVTVSTDFDSCAATSVSIDDGSFDPDEGTITLSQFPSEPYPVGDTLVTLTVTDETGLSDSCTATVTVEDNTPPAAVTQDITVQLNADGNASIIASDIDAGSSDPCGIVSMTVSPSDFTCADLGENTVTLKVTDVNGNTSSASATVTVEDNIAPTIDINAPATIIPPDAPISFTATAEDNCSAEVEITDYFCYKIKKDGSQQSKMDGCEVSLSVDTITITDSGGVDDNIVWTVLATDQSENTTTAEGHVLVANPGQSKKKRK